MSRITAIFRHQVRLLFGDPGIFVQYLFVPLLLMAILKPASEVILQTNGFRGANGAEQVVPGLTAMFAFFWIRSIGELFLSEHKWGTWDRLQTSYASAVQIMLGKLLPIFLMIVLQNVVLLGLGTLIFDLNANGAVLGLVPVFLALDVCVVALAVALVALCRTIQQVDSVGTLLTLLFSTLGGAIVPAFSLPSLAEDVAPATPTYWVTDAASLVILEGEGASAVLGPTAALLGFTTLFALVAATRFRFAETKTVEA